MSSRDYSQSVPKDPLTCNDQQLRTVGSGPLGTVGVPLGDEPHVTRTEHALALDVKFTFFDDVERVRCMDMSTEPCVRREGVLEDGWCATENANVYFALDVRIRCDHRFDVGAVGAPHG